MAQLPTRMSPESLPKFYAIAARIRAEYAKPSLTLLCMFIDGYMFRQYEIYGDTNTYENNLSFQEYVQSYYNVSRTTDSSCMLILKNSSNEKEAFYKYFELFDQYKAHR